MEFIGKYITMGLDSIFENLGSIIAYTVFFLGVRLIFKTQNRIHFRLENNYKIFNKLTHKQKVDDVENARFVEEQTKLAAENQDHMLMFYCVRELAYITRRLAQAQTNPVVFQVIDDDVSRLETSEQEKGE